MKKLTADDFRWEKWPALAVRFLSSYGLATAVLVLMTVITLLGTLYQVDHGLFAAKQKYFQSFFLIHHFGDGVPLPRGIAWLEGFPLPLPGGMLLMALLFVNLVIGALIKVKKRLLGLGMLIAHFGILFLLLGGFVTHFFATDGFMALYEGQSSNQVKSYRNWQVEILPLDENGQADKAWVINHQDLVGLGPDGERVFRIADLPFDVVARAYVKNGIPVPVSAPMAAQAMTEEADGFRLLPQKTEKEAEQNLPAFYADFRPKDGAGSPVTTILSARSSAFDPREKPMAFGFEMGGKKWAARMVKENWTVPFTVKLDKFIFERHPGVSMARNYESRITRIEDGAEKELEIKMNEPMRYEGYTFFQESFGPSNAGPNDAMYSQFAVANNPADQWPLWALLINGFGLAIHFIVKLISHIMRSRENAAGPVPETSPAPVP